MYIVNNSIENFPHFNTSCRSETRRQGTVGSINYMLYLALLYVTPSSNLATINFELYID